MRRTGKASPRTNTSAAIWPIGMNSCAVIRECSSIRAPAAAGETIWKPSAAPCLCCGAIFKSFDGRSRLTFQEIKDKLMALSSWIPFYGTGVYYTTQRTVENVRSHSCPSFGICVDVRKKDIDWDLYRRLTGQWRQMAGYMMGDYYPLTPYSLGGDRWIAWQFNCPEESGRHDPGIPPRRERLRVDSRETSRVGA